jgi:hypothetical protein
MVTPSLQLKYKNKQFGGVEAKGKAGELTGKVTLDKLYNGLTVKVEYVVIVSGVPCVKLIFRNPDAPAICLQSA